MTADKRRELHLRSMQAAQIAIGHLKASSDGTDPTSLRSAKTYLTKALDACTELAAGHENPLDPTNMLNHEQKETIQQPAGSAAGNTPA